MTSEIKPWKNYLTERDKAVLAKTGYGKDVGFGKRPAILVIDVNYAFAGDHPEPILDSIVRWKNSCGEEAWVAIDAISKVVESGREKGLPIIYSTSIRRPDEWDDGSWAWKNSRSGEQPMPPPDINQYDIVKPIAPTARDVIIPKQKPSAFFGTNLASYLVLLGADSLIVMGTTTSGCVRASVIDGFSYNYRICLVEDGCFDRSQASHAINMFDMEAKYADAKSAEVVIEYIKGLGPDLFELPSGIPV